MLDEEEYRDYDAHTSHPRRQMQRIKTFSVLSRYVRAMLNEDACEIYALYLLHTVTSTQIRPTHFPD